MEKFFTISKTAKMVDMTTETLRHYDRINLVKPCKTDEWTGYRYYSGQEVVRLNTIKALQCMDLTLAEIKEILEYSDFDKIIKLLKQAEMNAESKIAELEYSKAKIQRARKFYESKLQGENPPSNLFIKTFPQRVLLLSDTMEQPTLNNLWDYHRHYYDQIGENDKSNFVFEDLAGIYEKGGIARLFAVCTKYKQINGLNILPKGEYLCADCTEETREQILKTLLDTAKTQYNIIPEFTVHLIVLSGILQWNYQIQILIKKL